MTALDGATELTLAFTISNAVPSVLVQDISPTFTRYDDTTSDVSNFSTENLTFYISPVSIYEHEGNYAVAVSNTAGISQATIHLDVQSKRYCLMCRGLGPCWDS